MQGSAHVEWIDWEPGTRVLTVSYKGGRVYRYADVPYDTWAGLMKAPSKGSFLRCWVQPKFAAVPAGER